MFRGCWTGDGEDEADLIDLSDKELMAARDDDLSHEEAGLNNDENVSQCQCQSVNTQILAL